MASAGKTVRFAQIVERSGQPRPHTSWVAPAKDAELQRAIATDRVMTVEPGGRTGKTDVGAVGFHPHAGGQLLIFPKSLKRFAGARVVGIKFDLVEHPSFARAEELKRAATAARPSRRRGKTGTAPVPVAVSFIPAPDTTPEASSASPALPHAAKGRAATTPKVQAHRRAPENHAAGKTATSREADDANVRAPREPSRFSKRAAKRRDSPSSPSAAATHPGPADPKLLTAVRAALKDLEAGKAVAAFQRLQRAAAAAES